MSEKKPYARIPFSIYLCVRVSIGHRLTNVWRGVLIR